MKPRGIFNILKGTNQVVISVESGKNITTWKKFRKETTGGEVERKKGGKKKKNTRNVCVKQPSDEGTLTRERLLCHLTAPIIRCVHTVSINIMYYIIYILYIYISDNIDY